MTAITRMLSLMSSFIMGFTVIDALCFILTGDALAKHFLDGGSPLSRALFEMVPGMSGTEFLAANAIVLVCISVLLFVSVYGTMHDNDFDDIPEKGPDAGMTERVPQIPRDMFGRDGS